MTIPSETEKFLFQNSNFFSAEMSAFLQQKVLLMPNWKWIFLGAAVGLGIFLIPILQLVLRWIKRTAPIARRYPKSFTAYLFASPLEKPVAWVLMILIWFAITTAIGLPAKLGLFVDHLLRGLVAFFIIRMIYLIVDAFSSVMADYTTETPSLFDDQLVPFASKIAKILVVTLGFLIVLQSFGLNVVSLLAGLGLGGLALALAAQDTAANLFGSVTILFDRPFQVGDWIKVKDLEGSVEEIGFRSTRIRTFYNSLVTIPNGTMAKEYIDNMGARNERRVRQVLGITYDTPPELIKDFCTCIQKYLQNYPQVDRLRATVYFHAYSESSLDIMVNFHLAVQTADEENEHRQAIFLEILKMAEAMKVGFAFPSRTVYHISGDATLQERFSGNTN